MLVDRKAVSVAARWKVIAGNVQIREEAPTGRANKAQANGLGQWIVTRAEL